MELPRNDHLDRFDVPYLFYLKSNSYMHMLWKIYEIHTIVTKYVFLYTNRNYL